jgi:hypothetical protein
LCCTVVWTLRLREVRRLPGWGHTVKVEVRRVFYIKTNVGDLIRTDFKSHKLPCVCVSEVVECLKVGVSSGQEGLLTRSTTNRISKNWQRIGYCLLRATRYNAVRAHVGVLLVSFLHPSCTHPTSILHLIMPFSHLPTSLPPISCTF